tara:strand:+ start:206 stop:544 length:339 start_codon:yes stop_codon:yes gene_type:complete
MIPIWLLFGDGTATEYRLGQIGIDRSPVEDRRIRRVIDIIGNTKLDGIIAESGRLKVPAATVGAKGAAYQVEEITDLSQTISNPPTQAEVQALTNKVDELLAGLRAAGILDS